jgi:DNA polymerase I-like protein with 3'-5' exonuclease and polymerase domains/uracil-DNA glycosylase
MIVGEAPGSEEELKGIPFVGPSGWEMDRMLHEAGISRSRCFITNVCKERPYNNDLSNFIAPTKKAITPDHIPFKGKWVKREIIEGYEQLKREIELVKPKMIITVGNTSMWALTGLWGITKWRGSMLKLEGSETIKVIPTYHPAMILRQWEYRAIAVNDFKRAAQYTHKPYPERGWQFRVRPSYSEVLAALEALMGLAEERAARRDAEASGEAEPSERIGTAKPSDPIDLSVDLETRHGHIACIGIAHTTKLAICIPFMCVENKDGYWSEEEEAEIVWRLYLLLTHPCIQVIGQNFIYDSQYTLRHWMFVARNVRDTMISHHVTFCALPKNLGFQASMYNEEYVYWKDDGKEWDKKMGEVQLWVYNCEDCVRTMECDQVEMRNIQSQGLVEVNTFQQAMFWPILDAMHKGIRIDKAVRATMGLELLEEMTKREEWFKEVLGHPLNPRSGPQMQTLFYDDLRQPMQRNRKTGQPTLDDDAMTRLAAREPLLRPLVKKINEYRSLGVFLGTFVKAPLDYDDRMRCSYNPCGAYTYRLSSSKSAFDIGTNLQNIPEGIEAKEPEDLDLPNIRKMFIPDEGYEFFNLDLDRADLQVVVWEADDKELKEALRLGVDMHCFNAVSMYNIKGIPAEELIEAHPNYKEHRARIGNNKRQRMKSGVHAVDYFCKGRTLAITLGTTVHEADQFIKDWLDRHPGIKRWHERTEVQINKYRRVTNKFGYRWDIFDRVDGVLPDALAWIPQSTVAIYINRIWLNIHRSLRPVHVLLQVHDSLAGQHPIGFDSSLLRGQANIVVPYDDPLVIPVTIKTSPKSWGDCH